MPESASLLDIPKTPVCWSWEPFPLPQPNGIWVLRDWQQCRCAICGVFRDGVGDRARLYIDHCHASGNTRGLLCPRCNALEGKSDDEVFQKYRQRYPTMILGLLLWKDGYADHPDVRNQGRAVDRALHEISWMPEEEWSPLGRALANVGMTSQRWEDTKSERRAWQGAPTAHLPSETNPPRNACGDGGGWSEPNNAYRYRPCVDCLRLDPNRWFAMTADGRDGLRGQRHRRTLAIVAANRWRVQPTAIPLDNALLG